MSNAIGKVIFKDNTVRYAEYNGTTDILYPLSYKTYDEFIKNRLIYPEEPNCEHKNVETVTLHSDYGSGFSWIGECCKDCGWITKDNNPYQE